MSTHLEHPHALRDLTAMDHEITRRLAENDMMQYSTADADGDEDDLYGTSDPVENGKTLVQDDSYISLGKAEVDIALQQPESSLNQIQSSSLADQHSTSVAAHDSHSAPAQVQSTPANTTPPSGDASLSFQEPHDPSQDTSMNTDQSSTATDDDDDDTDRKSGSQLKKEEDAEEDVANEGVNFQSLLDNISQSNVTASQADHPPPPTSTSSTSSSVNAPFPPPVGLPPRPPPQESPAIHPNYAPGQDIRAYHQTPAPYTSALPTQASHASNSYRPSQGYAHPIVAAGAPGTSSAPNGLPPPPMATFQQPPRISDQTQNSPVNQHFQQRDIGGKSGSGNAISTDGSNDGPWPPQLERRYNEFLDKERIYVTEGLWDRFPQGSRLFVGTVMYRIIHWENSLILG